MNNKTIEIDSFNPYESIFPNRKVVTRDTLVLIKILRAEGYEVIVKPKNKRPIEYLFKKSVTDFLSNPTNQLIISIPVTISINIISNWIQKLVDKNSKSNKGKESNSIIIVNQTTNNITNSFNKTITKEEVKESRKKRKTIAKSFEECLKTRSPFLDLPFPILLDHKPVIIGWCQLKETDIGLNIEKGIITNKNVHRKMKEGKFKGASVTGIAKKSICTICNKNYVDCNHIAGEEYNGKSCNNKLIKNDLIEVSIVKEPINPKTFAKFI